MRGWLWAPLIAVQFLTRIPVRGVPDRAYDEDGGRRRALVFFPLVGLVVGAVGAAVWALAHALGLPPLAGAVGAVAATAAVTGAFHEDGLADTSDALGPHTREDALRVMRDSRIGTFGTVALWTVLTLKASALVALPPHGVGPLLLCAHVLARWSSLPLAMAMPYAQETRGLGAGLASLATAREFVPATLLALLAVGLLSGPLHAALLVAGALAVVVLTGTFYRHKFGGVTGDCLGATNQMVETVTLLIAAAPAFRHLG